MFVMVRESSEKTIESTDSSWKISKRSRSKCLALLDKSHLLSQNRLLSITTRPLIAAQHSITNGIFEYAPLASVLAENAFFAETSFF